MALWGPVVGVTVASAHLALLTGAAWRARRRGAHLTAPRPAGAPPHRFVVLVPAHDEARGIRATLDSLAAQDHPRTHWSVHVVADHCTDATATVARAGGAEVHERDDGERGKGPALAWLLDRLDARGDPYDAVVVVDADSVVSPTFLSVVDTHLARGATVVQAHYTVRQPEESWAIGLRTAALAVRHYLRPLARTSWGGSAGLYGNGMAFAADVLRRHRWAAHLTEDIELEARLLLEGIVVTFAPDARVEAEMPARLADAASQVERWERGRIDVARQYVPALLRAARGRRGRDRLRLVDAAVDHLQPPFAVLVGATAATLVGAAGLVAVAPGRAGRGHAAVTVAAAVTQATYLASGLRQVDAPPAVWWSLVRAPAYLTWRTGGLRHLVSERTPTPWVRTTRNAA